MEKLPSIKNILVTVILAVNVVIVCYASSTDSTADSASTPTPSGECETCLVNSISDVSVTRTSHKQGFHRNVLTNITANTSLVSHVFECKFLLVESLPEGLYVDIYQLQASRDLASSQVLAFEEIDVEKPEYLSSNHTIYVYSHNAQLADGHQLTASIDLPVHLRYHQPSDDPAVWQSFVHLPPPEIYVVCSDCSQATTPCDSTHQAALQAPCTADNTTLCDWTPLIYNLDAWREVEFEVPVGQAGHGVLVTVLTLTAIVIGTVILLWTIIKENAISSEVTGAKAKWR